MTCNPWGPFGPDKTTARRIWAAIFYVLLGLATAAAIGSLLACDLHPPTPPGPVDPVDPPPDPPAPAPTVRVYVGVYDLMGATGDVDAYLRDCKAAGATGVRFFVCYSWQGPQPISPYLQVGTWTHDNGITFPLYRLAEWNPEYWRYLGDVLTACAGHGLTAWLVVEDFCSLKGDQHVKYFNPMYSSEEALGPSTPGGVWGDSQKVYHAALFDRCIAAARTVPGLSWLIEPMNEYDIIDGSNEEVIDWHAWAVDEIRKRDVPLARIVGTAGRQASAIAAQVGLFSPHGIGRPDQVQDVPGVPREKVVFSSDGYWGGGTDCDLAGKCSFGVDGAAALGARLIEFGRPIFEWLPRMVYGRDRNRADLTLFDGSILKALAFAK